MKHIALLGATGSIGGNVLEIVRQFPERYRIVSLAAGQNIALLAAQTMEFQPLLVATGDAAGARKLRQLVPASWSGDIVYGEKGAIQAASLPEAEVVVSAIVGAAGLLPTLAAIRAGKDIALANKETLVMAGAVVMQELAAYGGHLFPVDSEHSAIFQALEAGRRQDAAKIILTASGGPFLGQMAKQLQQVTPQQALRHPRWQMGQKISIDSATLMNKGLEVIEAHWLFAMPAAQIEVVVHPQSVVHSLVEFCDGSVVAQLGIADMRIPIAYALSYPERLPLCLPSLSLTQWSQLDFLQPDMTSFPALRLAYEAAACGGAAPAVLNAANEVAVAAFLQEQLAFPDICRVVEATLQKEANGQGDDLESILAADASARRTAAEQIQALSSC